MACGIGIPFLRTLFGGGLLLICRIWQAGVGYGSFLANFGEFGSAKTLKNIKVWFNFHNVLVNILGL